MGGIGSKKAGRDFTEVRHINRTHVEVGRKSVYNKEGGFRLFDYVDETAGPTTIIYSNGTQHTIPARPKAGFISDLHWGGEIAIAAVVAVIVVWALLRIGRACIKYRNYKRFHDFSIGDENRERRRAYKSILRKGPTPKACGVFYSAYRVGDAEAGGARGRERTRTDKQQQQKRSQSIDSVIIEKNSRRDAKRRRRSSSEC